MQYTEAGLAICDVSSGELAGTVSDGEFLDPHAEAVRVRTVKVTVARGLYRIRVSFVVESEWRIELLIHA